MGSGIAKQLRQIVHYIVLPLPFDKACGAQLHYRFRFHFAGLHHHRRRHRIGARAGFDQQRRNHGQRQRQVQRETGAALCLRAHFNAAAKCCGFGAHHIHADAAPCNRRQFRCCGKAGLINHLCELRFIRRLARGEQAALDRLVADAFVIEAAAIVADDDFDFVAGLHQRQPYLALRRLAACRAHSSGFDAMYHGIAQQMFNRPGHALQHRAIKFGFAALNRQRHLLACLLRCLSQHALQAFCNRGKGHHTHAHQMLRQLAAQACLLRECRIDLIEIAGEGLFDRGNVVHAFGEDARQLLQPRVAIHFERIELLVACLRAARLEL